MRWTFVAAWVALGLLASPVAAEPDTLVPDSRAQTKARQDAISARAKQGDVDLIFIGDSITQGWEGNGKDVWQKYYGSRHAMNAGIGGDRTQHLLWRLDHGNLDNISPKLAVLMIGTNNAARNEVADTAAGVKADVALIRKKLPNTKILLLAIFPRGETPEDPLRQKNAAVNDMIQSLADGKMVEFLDIGPKFLGEGGKLSREIMPDLLHLSPAGYEIWATAIEPQVSQVLGPTSGS
jgi:beta-glucosidase